MRFFSDFVCDRTSRKGNKKHQRYHRYSESNHRQDYLCANSCKNGYGGQCAEKAGEPHISEKRIPAPFVKNAHEQKMQSKRNNDRCRYRIRERPFIRSENVLRGDENNAQTKSLRKYLRAVRTFIKNGGFQGEIAVQNENKRKYRPDISVRQRKVKRKTYYEDGYCKRNVKARKSYGTVFRAGRFFFGLRRKGPGYAFHRRLAQRTRFVCSVNADVTTFAVIHITPPSSCCGPLRPVRRRQENGKILFPLRYRRFFSKR